MPHPPHNHNYRRGFTLLESLVVLVLAGLVTAGVALSLRTGFDASRRMQARADAHAEARAVLETLTADLSAAFLSGANTEETLFVGTPVEAAGPDEPFLSLTALSYRRRFEMEEQEMPEPRSDAVRVDYLLQPAPDGSERNVLLRKERWLTESGTGEIEVLCERVADLRLSYLGNGGEEEEWSEGVSENLPLAVSYEEDTGDRPRRRRLPRAVRVTVLLAPASNESEVALPRAYTTLVLVGAGGVAPFEIDVAPPVSQGEPGAEQPGPGTGRGVDR